MRVFFLYLLANKKHVSIRYIDVILNYIRITHIIIIYVKYIIENIDWCIITIIQYEYIIVLIIFLYFEQCNNIYIIYFKFHKKFAKHFIKLRIST